VRVKWVEFPNIDYMDPPNGYHPVAIKFEGEVMGTVRCWGTTTLLVMLDDGKMREIAASLVEKALAPVDREPTT